MKRTLILAATLAALSAPAFAQVVPDGPPGHDATGSGYPPHTQSPTPNMDTSTTGRSEVNARASGCYQAREPSRACDELAARNPDRTQGGYQKDQK